MTRNPIKDMMIMIGAIFGLMFLIVMVVDIDSAVNYSLGAEVITTNEYNKTFNDSFTGHIIRKENHGFMSLSYDVIVQLEDGETKRIYPRYIKEV